MKNRSDLNQSYAAFEQASTIVSVVELSSKSWLAAGTVPGVKRQPRKNLSCNPDGLLTQIERWRAEAVKAGHEINRIVVAFEAGRDGVWLARFLRARGIEAYVIHAASIPVPREHKRPKTDRLDTEMLMRALLGWLRGEARHCRMVEIPALEQEDAKRPSREHDDLVRQQTSLVNRMKSTLVWLGITNFNIKLVKAGQKLAGLRTPGGEPIPPNTLAELYRDLERLAVIRKQIKAIEEARLQRLKAKPAQGTNPLVLMLAQVLGLGLETADLLVHEVLTRNLRDHRAVGRYGGLTGSPDESGKTRREQGLSKAGNWRVRHSSLQLAWRWLKFQKGSALAQWYRARTAGGGDVTRKKMIVALARKILIALWRYMTTGELPAGVVLKPAAI
ncbi:MAG TPA: IS110 family transposase [Steroidobacteraceae bacterium]|nr:IS110 family transposase [Steroidobacteraceae bacterium]